MVSISITLSKSVVKMKEKKEMFSFRPQYKNTDQKLTSPFLPQVHQITDLKNFFAPGGKKEGYVFLVPLLPCLFNLYAEYVRRNAGLEEAQAGIQIAGRNINNLRYADDTTIMEES